MLVERVHEARALRGAAEALLGGAGSVVTVVGEPGIGKTALLNDFVAGLSPSVRLWAGGCDDLPYAGELGPLREALDAAGAYELERESHGELHHFVAALARALSHGPPTVLLVEDLQWGDDQTLDVVTYFSRRIERFPLLIVLSYREEDLGSDHSVHRYLAGIHPHSTQVRPAPLTIGGVATLCAGGAWDAPVLWRLTGGNPFYVVQALGASPAAPVTGVVAGAVAARLRGLSPLARGLLERLSVWPGTLRLDLAEEFLGENLAVLVEAEARGLVVADPDGLRFCHELTRLAVLAALPRLQRRWHAREAVALLTTRQDADLQAVVPLAVTGEDPAILVRLGPQAAEAAARAGATDEAVKCYEAVLDHESLLDDAALADLRYAYAGELRKANRLAAAIESCGRAADLCAARGDVVGHARTLARLSRYLFWIGERIGARARAEQSVALSRGRDEAVAADALLSLGMVMAQDGADPLPLLERARVLAGQAHRRDLVARSLSYAAQYGPRMSHDARLELIRASIDVARDANDLHGVIRNQAALAELLHRFGRYDDLERLLGQALPRAWEHGFRDQARLLQVCSALVMLRRGQWDTAETHLREIRASEPDGGLLTDFAGAAYGRLLARRGDPAAEGILVECWIRALRHRWLPILGLTATALVEWSWLNGDSMLLGDVVGAWGQHARRPAAAPFDLEVRRFARLAGVDVPDEAPLRDAPALPWAAALVGRSREAAQRCRDQGDVYAMALELAVSGEERTTLRAWHLLNDMGADPAARRVRERLRALGVRSMPRRATNGTRANPGGLTDRQMEVANLVREGLTNPEIAARLVLSVRTVDHHVSSVLAKLGLRTRRDVMTSPWGFGAAQSSSR